MKIDDITRQSLLYDFYGALLTERQKEVMELYHEENLSLAEIAEEFGISRQGVHDALHKAEKSLEHYEEKLGLVERFNRTSDAISEIDSKIEQLSEKAGDTGFASDLESIRSIIDKLEA
ncbi:MAG: YlxM family DNA-binding protein [Bacillota bacterium]|nr:YlxM family DNA-binding protein [Bacillota bacterium]